MRDKLTHITASLAWLYNKIANHEECFIGKRREIEKVGMGEYKHDAYQLSEKI